MKNNTKKTLLIYLKHVGKYKFTFFTIILSIISGSVLATVVPLYLKKFFDILSQSGDKTFIAENLIKVLVIIAAIEIIEWALWRLGIFLASILESRVIYDLSNYCFQYLHKHSFGFFNNNFVGSLVRRVGRFTRSFESITDRVIFNFLQLAVNLSVIVFILYRTNFWLGLAISGWMLVFFAVNLIFVRYKLKYDLMRSEADTKVSGLLADSITNNANIKLFNGYARESESMRQANDKVRGLRLFTWNLSSIFDAIQSALSIVLEIGLFYIAIQLWKLGILTVGDFVLIQAYILTVILRIWDFGKMVQRVYEDIADAEEMTDILTTPHEIQDVPNAKNLIIKKGEIFFDDVNFNYNNTRQILKNFSLKIKPGEKVALVGASGSGKTTIVKILLRMFELTAGKIFIDGQNITKVKQESLWKSVSMVPQDPVLFHRSLMENIRYGKPDAGDKEVIVAAKLAHCHEFISEFPDKYGTFVGERGMMLSGGERQRVAIARAILRNAPVLVLDEATSSLDSQSEFLIQDALANLMKNKTVIVIAHRLSTIMKMDRILVVGKGKVVEEGAHKTLLKKRGGLYKKLWSLQAGGFIN